MAISDAAFLVFRFCSYTVRHVICSTIGLLSVSYTSCLVLFPKTSWKFIVRNFAHILLLLYGRYSPWSADVLTTWYQTPYLLPLTSWTQVKNWSHHQCPQSGSSRGDLQATGLLQSAGGRSAAVMTLWWSSSGLGAVRASCPKKLSRRDLTQPDPDNGEQAVILCNLHCFVNTVPGVHCVEQ